MNGFLINRKSGKLFFFNLLYTKTNFYKLRIFYEKSNVHLFTWNVCHICF